jgi:hypothetical protein
MLDGAGLWIKLRPGTVPYGQVREFRFGLLRASAQPCGRGLVKWSFSGWVGCLWLV